MLLWKLRYEAHLAPLFLSLFVALALAGCAVGPDYLRPELSAPSVEFKQAAGWKSAAPADTALRGDWWTLYDDPELDR